MRVLYILNDAPNYREKFLSEFGKKVDLTVVSFSGKSRKLKDPEVRSGYKFIELSQKRLFNISFQYDELRYGGGEYDVIILGYCLRNPFRILNIFRNKRILFAGLIYGRAENLIVAKIRNLILSKSDGVLVYSAIVKNRLEKEIKKPISSFNNTSFQRNEILPLPMNSLRGTLNLLWIGRYQSRKKIERLIKLAKRNPLVRIRLIGPDLKVNLKDWKNIDNLEILDAAYGDELTGHFQWCHAVFNPGGAGLLVMNAARFSRPIVIDRDSHHGPEIQLALEAGQKFIDFGNDKEVDETVDYFFKNEDKLKQYGDSMGEKMHNYTIEYMVSQYVRAVENK